MNRVMDKHRDGIVIKQVAGGREFQGCAFYSKPDVVHFKVIYMMYFHFITLILIFDRILKLGKHTRRK